jgi:protein tyrosine phosphatase (PTP) superfamily phosphohydrolase (DUF442 family)
MKNAGAKNFLVLSFACLTLSSCQSDEVDQYCLWGPDPSHEKLAELKARGVKTIVNVRLNPMKGKEDEARRLGMRYEHIPTGLFKPPTKAHIDKFLTIVRNPDNLPIYICDQVAHDRVQFYAAVYGMHAHKWSAKKGSEVMYKHGLRRWWPWFYKYKGVVKKYEADIQSDTAASALEQQRSSAQINEGTDGEN